MYKDKVLKVDTCCNYADVTLVHQACGPIMVIYKVCLPENTVIKPVLNVGDSVGILQDNKKDIAYLYNGYLHFVAAPQNSRNFVKNLSFADRIKFATALRREFLRNKKLPSLVTYKNLQKILAKNGLVR